MMRLCASAVGVQAIDRIGRERDRRVETETARRPDDVVVDRLRHADDGNAFQVELVRDAQRAVAADHDERLQSHLVKRLDDAIRIVDLCLPACRPDIRTGCRDWSCPRMVPPRRRMPVTSLGVRMRDRDGSSRPSKLSSRPTTSIPALKADLTTARMTALRPGASPPPVSTPIRLIEGTTNDYI